MNKHCAMGSIIFVERVLFGQIRKPCEFLDFDEEWHMCNANGEMQKDMLEDFG